MKRLMENFNSTKPVPKNETFTYCAPIPSAVQQVNLRDLSDQQLDTVLRTHLGIGELYSQGVYTGLTVPTDANAQRLQFRVKGGKAGVKAEGSDVPYSNVVGVDIRTCAGPVHVIDSVLTPRGLETAFAIAEGPGAGPLGAPAPAPDSAPGPRSAGGGGGSSSGSGSQAGQGAALSAAPGSRLRVGAAVAFSASIAALLGV